MSAPDPEHQGWINMAMTSMGAALMAIGTWAWNHTHSRIKDVDAKADGKASSEEVDRHRDHIGKLFEKIEELGDKTEVKFTVLERMGTERHIELMKAIHEGRK